MLSYTELTSPERELWDAFPEGRQVDLRTGTPERDRVAEGGLWGPERTVRAEVVVALLLGAHPAQPGAVASLRLAGARIPGRLALAGAQIEHPLWIEDCWFEDSLDLLGASAKMLVVTGSRVPGIEADSVRVEGNFDLRRTVVEPLAHSPFNERSTALSLADARVSGALVLNGAQITAPGGTAVSAGGLAMEGGLFGRDGFVTRGEVRLPGAQLPGGLLLEGARFLEPGPSGVVLTLDNAVISTFDVSEGFFARGAIRLRGTQASALRDSLDSWPDVVELDGFVYGSVEMSGTAGAPDPRDSVAHRLAWIARSPGYRPGPYEQLAGWYRQAGHDDEARRVLLVKQRRRRRTLPLAGRVWGHLLDVTVGYGYRPWLAGIWLIALTLLSTLAFGSGSPHPVKPGEGSPFQPFVYSLDLLIPIGGLGQRAAWYWSDGGLQALAYVLIAFGWILTTALIAGVTRTLQKS